MPRGGKRKRTVTVFGRGSAGAAPDQAEVRVGVRSAASAVGEATEATRVRMDAVLSALQAQGVEDRQVRTIDYRVDVEPDRAGKTALYHATSVVQVRIDDPARLGAALDAVVAAGANEIYGVQLTLSDPGAVEKQARAAALADATTRAAEYAAQIGATLGEVLEISEATESYPRGVRLDAASGAGRSATPVRTGEIDVTAQVQVVYALI